MKTTRKRLLALLLASVMSMGSFPFAAFAEGTAGDTASGVEITGSELTDTAVEGGSAVLPEGEDDEFTPGGEDKPLVLSTEDLTIGVGETAELSVVDGPYGVAVLGVYFKASGQAVTVEVSDENPLSCQIQGVEPGQAEVSVQAGELTAVCKITVSGEADGKPDTDGGETAPPDADEDDPGFTPGGNEPLILSKDALSITVGTAADLEITGGPHGAALMGVSFESSNQSVAVAEPSEENPLSCQIRGAAEGSAVITVTAGQLTASCTVTVEAGQLPPDALLEGENKAIYKLLQYYKDQSPDNYYSIAALAMLGEDLDKYNLSAFNPEVNAHSSPLQDANAIMRVLATGKNPRNYRNTDMVSILEKKQDPDTGEMMKGISIISNVICYLALEVTDAEYDRDLAFSYIKQYLEKDGSIDENPDTSALAYLVLSHYPPSKLVNDAVRGLEKYLEEVCKKPFSEVNFSDEIGAVYAAANAGVSPGIYRKKLETLLTYQLPDGGFPFSPILGYSNTIMTGQMIYTLAAYRTGETIYDYLRSNNDRFIGQSVKEEDLKAIKKLKKFYTGKGLAHWQEAVGMAAEAKGAVSGYSLDLLKQEIKQANTTVEKAQAALALSAIGERASDQANELIAALEDEQNKDGSFGAGAQAELATLYTVTALQTAGGVFNQRDALNWLKTRFAAGDTRDVRTTALYVIAFSLLAPKDAEREIEKGLAALDESAQENASDMETLFFIAEAFMLSDSSAAKYRGAMERIRTAQNADGSFHEIGETAYSAQVSGLALAALSDACDDRSVFSKLAELTGASKKNSVLKALEKFRLYYEAKGQYSSSDSLELWSELAALNINGDMASSFNTAKFDKKIQALKGSKDADALAEAVLGLVAQGKNPKNYWYITLVNGVSTRGRIDFCELLVNCQSQNGSFGDSVVTTAKNLVALDIIDALGEMSANSDPKRYPYEKEAALKYISDHRNAEDALETAWTLLAVSAAEGGDADKITALQEALIGMTEKLKSDNEAASAAVLALASSNAEKRSYRYLVDSLVAAQSVEGTISVGGPGTAVSDEATGTAYLALAAMDRNSSPFAELRDQYHTMYDNIGAGTEAPTAIQWAIESYKNYKKGGPLMLGRNSLLALYSAGAEIEAYGVSPVSKRGVTETSGPASDGKTILSAAAAGKNPYAYRTDGYEDDGTVEIPGPGEGRTADWVSLLAKKQDGGSFIPADVKKEEGAAHQAWAMLALDTVGASYDKEDALRVLLSLQNENGSFGKVSRFSTSKPNPNGVGSVPVMADAEPVEETAIALTVLSLEGFKDMPGVSAARSKSKGYLLERNCFDDPWMMGQILLGISSVKDGLSAEEKLRAEEITRALISFQIADGPGRGEFKAAWKYDAPGEEGGTWGDVSTRGYEPTTAVALLGLSAYESAADSQIWARLHERAPSLKAEAEGAGIGEAYEGVKSYLTEKLKTAPQGFVGILAAKSALLEFKAAEPGTIDENTAPLEDARNILNLLAAGQNPKAYPVGGAPVDLVKLLAEKQLENGLMTAEAAAPDQVKANLLSLIVFGITQPKYEGFDLVKLEEAVKSLQKPNGSLGAGAQTDAFALIAALLSDGKELDDFRMNLTNAVRKGEITASTTADRALLASALLGAGLEPDAERYGDPVQKLLDAYQKEAGAFGNGTDMAVDDESSVYALLFLSESASAKSAWKEMKQEYRKAYGDIPSPLEIDEAIENTLEYYAANKDLKDYWSWTNVLALWRAEPNQPLDGYDVVKPWEGWNAVKPDSNVGWDASNILQAIAMGIDPAMQIGKDSNLTWLELLASKQIKTDKPWNGALYGKVGGTSGSDEPGFSTSHFEAMMALSVVKEGSGKYPQGYSEEQAVEYINYAWNNPFGSVTKDAYSAAMGYIALSMCTETGQYSADTKKNYDVLKRTMYETFSKAIGQEFEMSQTSSLYIIAEAMVMAGEKNTKALELLSDRLTLLQFRDGKKKGQFGSFLDNGKPYDSPYNEHESGTGKAILALCDIKAGQSVYQALGKAYEELLKDTSPRPVIAGADDMTIAVGQRLDLLMGVTAKDSDLPDAADLTGDMIVTHDIPVAGSGTALVPGSYTVRYTVTNSFNKSTVVLRKVTVTEAALDHPPTIFAQDLVVFVGDAAAETLDRAVAYDDEDGSNVPVSWRILKEDADVTGTVTVQGVIADEVGEYVILYTAVDSQNHTAERRAALTVLPKQGNAAPVLKLKDYGIVDGRLVVKAEQSYDPWRDLSVVDREDGVIPVGRVTLTVDGSPAAQGDMLTPAIGEHTLVYTAADKDGFEGTLTVIMDAVANDDGYPVRVVDRTLAGVIRTTLELSPNAQLTRGHIRRLTSLVMDFTSQVTTDLAGLEYAENLENLLIPFSPIMSLEPIRDSKKLKIVDVRGADVSSLEPLRGAGDLIALSVNSTRVSDLSPLADKNKIIELYISSTRCSDLSVLRNMPDLVILSMNNIPATSIEALGGLTKLVRLEMGQNKIADLSPLTKLTNLENLYAARGLATNTDMLSGMTRLTSLDLDYNQITDLSGMSNLKSVTDVSLANNRIKDIGPLGELKGQLKRLVLYNNEIESVEPLRGAAIGRLELANNHIADMSPLAGSNFNAGSQVVDLGEADLEDGTVVVTLGKNGVPEVKDSLGNLMEAVSCSPGRGFFDKEKRAVTWDGLKDNQKLEIHFRNGAQFDITLKAVAVNSNRPEIKGEVTLKGKPYAGNTLTADASISNGETLVYEWIRVKDGTESAIDAAEKTYQLTEADLGATIYVKVSAAETKGFVKSKPVGPVTAGAEVTEIKDLAGLKAVANRLDGDYKLTADITIALTDNWTPIGNNDAPFSGVFDGNGHEIELNYDGSSSIMAVFGVIAPEEDADGNPADGTGTVKNLGVTGSVKNGGFQLAALLAATNFGTVKNCYAQGSVEATGLADGALLVANNNRYTGKIENCWVSGTVAVGKYSSKHPISKLSGTITDCYYDSEVYGPATLTAGTAKTTAEMQSEGFVNLLNENKGENMSWAYTEGQYPVLGSQRPGPDSGKEALKKALKESLPGTIETLFERVDITSWLPAGLARLEGYDQEKEEISKKYIALAEKELPALFERQDKGENFRITDLERIAINLAACGVDAAAYEKDGRNLIDRIYNPGKNSGGKDYIEMQGINAAIWALIALDTRAYEVPEEAVWSRTELINHILDNQVKEGGWSLSGEYTDADMTGMALTALAPHRSRTDVEKAVEKAVTALSKNQKDSGGFVSGGGSLVNAPSTAQVLMGLTANGTDPASAEFTKNGKNVIDALLSFKRNDGFAYKEDQMEADTVSSEQALQAVAQALYYLNGRSGTIYQYGPAGDNTAQTLQKLVDEVKALSKGSYSDESWKVLQDAVKEAEDALEAAASTDVLKGHITALSEALKGLNKGLFRLTEGEITDSENGKEAKLRIRVENTASEGDKAAVIAVLYNKTEGIRMDKYVSGQVTASKGQTADWECSFNIPKNGEYQIQIFVWDDLMGLNPLGAPLSVDVKK